MNKDKKDNIVVTNKGVYKAVAQYFHQYPLNPEQIVKDVIQNRVGKYLNDVKMDEIFEKCLISVLRNSLNSRAITKCAKYENSYSEINSDALTYWISDAINLAIKDKVSNILKENFTFKIDCEVK